MKRILLTISVLVAAVINCGAQNSQSEFFLDNNVYSYRINPALAGEKGFVGIAIGNIDIALNSNLGINSFLYPKPSGQGLVTGLNKSISSKEFLSRLKNVNSLNEDFGMSILAFGFWQKEKEVFHNVEINVREMANTSLPKDWFALLKSGSRETPYNLSNTNVSGLGFVEIAYGQSRSVNEKISVGGRAKLLLGLANVNTNFNDASLKLNGSELYCGINGELRGAIPFIKFGTKTSQYDPSRKNILDFSKMEFDYSNISPAGYGLTFDLGVTYKPLNDLTLSFSVLDLGALGWKYNTVGKSVAGYTFTGFALDLSGEGIQQESQKALDSAMELVEFEKQNGSVTSVEMLPCRLNLGARYRMPFYNRLSVGFLGTYRISRYMPWFDARFGATITPIDWLSLSGNYSFSTYGNNFGAVLSLNAASINFIFGLDAYSGKVSKLKWDKLDVPWLSAMPLPLGAFHYNLRLGITITFGTRHNDLCSIRKQ